MKGATPSPYQERYAAFLLRWAKFNDALPRNYATMALDRLRQRKVLGVTDQQLYGFKNSGNMPENPVVTDVLEELATQYHPDKIRSDKEARKFLRTWEPRPGRKVKAALKAAA
jgi:hypothetical protein